MASGPREGRRRGLCLFLGSRRGGWTGTVINNAIEIERERESKGERDLPKNQARLRKAFLVISYLITG